MSAAVNADELRSGIREAAFQTGALSHGRASICALGQHESPLYRSVLQEAVEDSPGLFRTSPDRESTLDQPDSRPRLLAARRLIAEQHGVAVGLASVNAHRDEATASNLTGLWVASTVRNCGVGTMLVEAAAALEAQDGRTQLYYWVGTENASATAFASNIGFRVTSHRRSAVTGSAQPQHQEVAFVMSLEPDPGTVPNASSAPLSQHPPADRRSARKTGKTA